MGTLRPILESRGYRTRYSHMTADRIRAIDPLESDILLVIGHHPLDLSTSQSNISQEALDLIRVRHHYGLPLLGVNLGAQLIVQMLGGELRPLPRPEIGLAPIKLTEAGKRSCLAPLGSATPVVHWHRHQMVLPSGLESLASSPHCAVQAYRNGTSLLGLQFHLEADADHLDRLIDGLRVPPELLGLDLMALRARATDSLQRMRHACHAVMTRWLDEVDGSAGDLDASEPAQPLG